MLSLSSPQFQRFVVHKFYILFTLRSSELTLLFTFHSILIYSITGIFDVPYGDVLYHWVIQRSLQDG
jgi:hypothetical protein